MSHLQMFITDLETLDIVCSDKARGRDWFHFALISFFYKNEFYIFFKMGLERLYNYFKMFIELLEIFFK